MLKDMALRDDYITDEMLAAFLDGKALPLERCLIEDSMSNEDIQEVIDIVADIKNNIEPLDNPEERIDLGDAATDLDSLKRDLEGNDTPSLM